MDWERDGITRRVRAHARLRRHRPGLLVRLRQARAHERQEERVRALGGLGAVRAVPARPADPAGRDGRSSATKQLEQYVITMKPGTADILPGLRRRSSATTGCFPGPTIKATRGRAVAGPPDQPERARPQRAPARRRHRSRSSTATRTTRSRTATERLYKYPNVARSATLWYHDHAHGETAPDAVRRPGRRSTCSTTRTTSTLDLPQGDYDVPLMIRTARSTPTGRSATGSTSTAASAATRSWSTARSRRG